MGDRVRALVEQGYGAWRRPWLVSLGLPDVESPRSKMGVGVWGPFVLSVMVLEEGRASMSACVRCRWW